MGKAALAASLPERWRCSAAGHQGVAQNGLLLSIGELLPGG
jgi:hypothetical protein